ncbi:UNVERIFIED_ORG: hypothetical protein DFS12_10427 [Chitinophaga ginsengisegetis]|nr:hypothetical protein [Chitinophaga ginsengisegetis]MDR6647968.1 hypothetical protein [Chitinophaga ginsengisegetis]MDR6654882.1 hypothetical protein [Chitinophaga ginsengisegetis]
MELINYAYLFIRKKKFKKNQVDDGMPPNKQPAAS